MRNLVVISIFLFGIFASVTGHAAAQTPGKQKKQASLVAAINLPASEPDIVHPVQLNNIQSSSRHHSPDDLFSVNFPLPRIAQHLYTIACNQQPVFHTQYLDHIYPTHNFW